MTAPAAIRQSDLRRVVAMAKESGCIIEVERDGMKIRVMPDIPTDHSKSPVDEDLAFGGNSLSEWRARHEGKVGGRPSGKKNTR